MEIYPAIDLKDAKCVRLEKGNFQTVSQVALDPVKVAIDYKLAGASIIHVVDLDGAKDGIRKNAAIVAEIAKVAHPAKIELGGGLRCMEDLQQADDLGVWRFILGSAAVENAEFVRLACEHYPNRIAIGVDAQDGKVKTRGWLCDTDLDYVKFSAEQQKQGVQTIIFTDIDTDGLQSGPSLEQLAALRKELSCCLVASGGVSSIDDIRALRKLGVEAAIAGKALYSGRLNLSDALFEARYGALFDKSELIPAIIQHYETKEVLMLGYMNKHSLANTLSSKLATFFSRSRQRLWVKGETSGNFLHVKKILSDCDNDTLLLECIPDGPICHTGSENCFFTTILKTE